MALDPRIILQGQGFQAPDMLGMATKAMTMKQMAMQGQAQERELQRQAGLRKAYAAGIVQNPDGTTSYNPQLTMSALAQGGYGQEAQAIGDQLAQRDILAAKTAQEFKLREQELMSRAADRKEARDERRFQAGLVRDEKMQGLQTPYGTANTIDDASKLKAAHELKGSFDNKIDQMIELRKKHSGGAIWNREDVARGKQLSKALLLDYKDMARLGVLSKSDEAILNAVIPEDPLQYNSPVAAIQGQDPTLTRLQAFKADSDKDFQSRIQTRTRSGFRAGSQPRWDQMTPAQAESEFQAQKIKPKGNAGKTIIHNGKKYLVGEDGDTLTEVGG